MRALWFLPVAVLLFGLVSVRLLDRPLAILYVRVVDDQTLALGLVSGPGTWTRVTTTEERTDTVTLEVSSMRAPVPGSGDDLTEVIIRLRDPIGARSVIDASSGMQVPRTVCLPPAYLAPGCT